MGVLGPSLHRHKGNVSPNSFDGLPYFGPSWVPPLSGLGPEGQYFWNSFPTYPEQVFGSLGSHPSVDLVVQVRPSHELLVPELVGTLLVIDVSRPPWS